MKTKNRFFINGLVLSITISSMIGSILFINKTPINNTIVKNNINQFNKISNKSNLDIITQNNINTQAKGVGWEEAQTGTFYNDNSHPFDLASSIQNYAYEWQTNNELIKTAVRKKFYKIFYGVDYNGIDLRDYFTVSYETSNDLEGWCIVKIRFSKYMLNGIFIDGNKEFTIKFINLLKVNPSVYSEPNNPAINTYFKFKSISPLNTIPSLVAKEIKDATINSGSGNYNNVLSVLTKYLYFGPLPTKIPDFSLQINSVVNNLTGELTLNITTNYIFMSRSSNNLFLSPKGKYDFNVIAPKGIFKIKTISIVDSSMISLEEISSNFSMADLFNQFQSNIVQQKLKSIIASKILLQANSSDSWFNQKYYNATDIVRVSLKQDESSNVTVTEPQGSIMEIWADISNWINIDNLVTKTYKFTIYTNNSNTIPTVIKNNNFPCSLSINEIKAKFDNDIQQQSSFANQKFFQSFITLKSFDPNRTKVIRYNLTQPNPNNPLIINIEFVFNNFPNSNTNNGEYSIHFEYNLSPSPWATRIEDIYINDFGNYPPLRWTGPDSHIYDVEFPYAFQAAFGSGNWLQEVVYKNIINKPGPIINGRPDSSNFLPSDVQVTVGVNQTSEQGGGILARVVLRKYIEVNPQTGQPEYISNGYKEQSIFIRGFRRAYSCTYLEIADQAFNLLNNVKPTELYDWSRTNPNEAKSKLLNTLFNIKSYAFSDENGKLLPKYKNLVIQCSQLEFVSPDNQQGTISVRITLPDVFAETGDIDIRDNCTYTLELNMLKANLSPTYLPHKIYDDNSMFAKYNAQQMQELLNNNSSPEAQTYLDEIKNTINKWLMFKPESFNTSNITKITATQYNVNSESVVFNNGSTRNYPYVHIEVDLDKCINNSGNLQPHGHFGFDFYAPFKSIQNTRLVSTTIPMQNVDRIRASLWIQEHTNWKTLLIDEIWKCYTNGNNNPQVISGDIPPLPFDKTNIEITSEPETNDLNGTITVYASLNKYWTGAENNQAYVSTGAAYIPLTKIVFRGFENQGITILPATGEYDISAIKQFSDHFASELNNNNSNFNVNQIKSYILNGITVNINNQAITFPPLITGNKTNITINDIEILPTQPQYGFNYTGTPNDLTGKLTLTIQMNKMYYLSSNGVNIIGPDINNSQIDLSKRQTTITLTNFQKRLPTTLETNIDVSQFPQYQNKVATELLETDLKQMIDDSALKGDIPPLDNAQNPNYVIDWNSRIVNAIQGIIKVDVSLKRYYHNNDALLVDTYLHPNNEVITKKLTFRNILKTEPTMFLEANEIELDPQQYNSIIQKIPQEINHIIELNDLNNPILIKLKKFAFDNIVIQGKLNLDVNDLSITNIIYNNSLGTVKVKLSLSRYWDSKCDFITSQSANYQPLTKTITLKTFKKVLDFTHIINGKISAAETEFSSYYPKKFDQLINQDLSTNQNSDFLLKVKNRIFLKLISGNIDGLSPKNIIIDSSTVNATNLADQEVIVSFHLNSYWNEQYQFVNTNSTTYQAVFHQFNSSKTTEIFPGPYNLRDNIYLYNETDYFNKENINSVSQILANADIEHKTIDVWEKELINQNSSVYEQLNNFVQYNFDKIVQNPVNNIPQQGDFTIDQSTIVSDNKTGSITFKLIINKTINAQGQICDAKAEKNITVTGFLQPGPTEYENIDSIPIDGSLYKYVTQNNITADQIGLSNSSIQPSGIDIYLTKFLFDKIVTGFKPLYGSGKLAPDNIVIKNISEQNTFKGSIKVEFTLNKWYDQDGILQKTEKPQFKIVTLTNFPTPISNNGTTEFKDNINIPISNNGTTNNSYFLNPDGTPKFDVNIFNQEPQSEEELRKWAYATLVSGNKDRLNYSMLKFIINNKDVTNGTISLTYWMDYAWKDGILQTEKDNPKCTVIISGFKTIKPTVINSGPYNLIDNINYTLPSYPNTNELLGAQEVIDLIKTKSVQQIYQEPKEKVSLENYIKEFIYSNIAKIISNLPKKYDEFLNNNTALANAIKNEIHITISPSFDTNNVNVQFQLFNYINQNGIEIDKNNNKPLEKILIFNGFFTTSTEPTSITNNNVLIDISKPMLNSDPWTNESVEGYKLANSEIKTNYENATEYYWKDSLPNQLLNNIVSNSNGQWSLMNAEGNFKDILKQWLINYNIINYYPDPTYPLNNIEIDMSGIKYDNTYGIISNIKYRIVYGFDNNGNLNPITDKIGTIMLRGFKCQINEANFNNTIIWWIVGGTAIGLICITLIVLIVIYRKRRDIEYNK